MSVSVAVLNVQGGGLFSPNCFNIEAIEAVSIM